MKRIVMHWSAGTHTFSTSDWAHYHEAVDGKGKRHLGQLRPEANRSIKDGVYAPHTRRLNTDSIGLAVCAMAGAKEHPFSAGKHPITDKQLAVFVKMVADYAETYGIPVTRETVLTHAEVEPTLGVKQSGKWDITWLPGMDRPRNAVWVGDRIREMVLAEMTEQPTNFWKQAKQKVKSWIKL